MQTGTHSTVERMRVLHLPSTFFPDFTGGKEVFVQQLIKNSVSIEHLVLFHEGVQPRRYDHEGTQVQVLPLATAANVRKSYFDLTYDHLSGFDKALDEFKPDIVHFHDESSGASLTHLLSCQAKGIRTLLSYHSPGQSCIQSALLYGGKKPSDGKVEVLHCTSCRYEVMGLPPVLARLAASVSLPFDRSGKFIKRNSTELFIQGRREFFQRVDAVQVHAHWVEQHLQLNEVRGEKIKFVTMGGHISMPAKEPRPRKPGDPIRLVFIGRCTSIKGAHLLIEAVKSLPEGAAVEVYFFGPYWTDTEYGRKMQAIVKDDKRFKEPLLVHPDKVVEHLRTMDVCVIPSLWPETGPFTVFDAFAAGIPVIGTNHAGIAERVRDQVDGLLFNWGDANDLKLKILSLIDDPGKIDSLAANIKPNVTFAAMGKMFETLYADMIRKKQGNV